MTHWKTVMPLFTLARLLTSLLSWVILAASIYLLASWYRGEEIVSVAGDLLRSREDWRLWTALALAAWSLGGRLPLTALVTRPDKRPTRPVREAGAILASPTGSSLYVEQRGESGPTILMTHGWGLDSTIWHDFKRDAAAGAALRPHRIVTWDLPGLGRSKAARGGVDLERFSEDLAFLIGRETGPVVLVGHSIGGMTIQTLARNQPALFDSRVAGVVLVNTTYTNPLKTMILSPLVRALRRPVLEPLFHLAIWLQPLAWLGAWQSYLSGSAHLANLVGFGRRPARSQLEHVTLLATRNPPGVQARGNLAMFDWDAAGAMGAVRCPVLILGGLRDIVTKVEASEAIARATPRARLDRVEEANHLGFLERADRYTPAILDFAAEVTAPASAGAAV